MSVYDSFDETQDGTLPIGGTSVSSPCWASLIAIANQGRALAGASSLDGPSQTLPALYTVSSNDFHDITSGSNGGFQAGPGYDEVTGLGSPVANLLVPDLVAYGAATSLVVTAQPPSNVIGRPVRRRRLRGEYPGWRGPFLRWHHDHRATANNPTGATLGGTLTVKASHGQAVFDDLTLNQLGTGYTFKITDPYFPSVMTEASTSSPTRRPAWDVLPGADRCQPRDAIAAAESNGTASNTIVLSSATYVLTDTTWARS